MNTILLSKDAPDTVSRGAQIIRDGGLLGIPTETVYGLGANGLDPDAVLKIFQAKGRPQDNPLILHVAAPSQVPAFCEHIPEIAWTLMETFWPGPLTLVLPAKKLVPRRTTGGLDTVAIRCPANALTRQIIEAAGVPIAAPSANRSGKPSPTTAAHVLHDMDGRIDGVIDGGTCSVGVESTIVDLTGDRPRLLRPGGVTPEQLLPILGDLEVDSAVVGELPPDAPARAPGMKYTHYTPAGDVIIVAGGRGSAARYILRHLGAQDKVLCFSEELSLYPPGTAIAYGFASQPETLAHGLFAALRDLDSDNIKTIYARCPTGGGVTYAVANRLKKAAGFHTVQGLPMPVIGITGPTGSGKTTALARIAARGGKVLDLDEIYHGLLRTDPALLAALAARFPGVVTEGTLDRKKLGRIVFQDKQALHALEEITGGFILAETDRLLKEADDAGAPFAAIDAINLLEGDLPTRCQCTIAVTAPVEVRVQRLMARDQISEEYARLRISAQKPASYFSERCDYTLSNDSGTQEDFARRCDRLLDTILK